MIRITTTTGRIKMNDIIIIGAGAAGLMAAAIASERTNDILIFDKNERIGRKLSITGKGRCNVTNNCNREEFFANIPVNPKFLYSAYSKFSCEDTMNFFEERGVPLKIERGNRVFPVSDKAEDIVNAFGKILSDKKIRVKKSGVTEIVVDESGTAVGVKSGNKIYEAKKILIATGGKSYPKTGSNGDGYILAENLGHTIISVKPSLVPIVTEEKYPNEMMGLSLKNVTLKLYDTVGKKTLFEEMGEMLFTHFGVSGPLVLSASSHIRNMVDGRYKLFIDLKPALDEKKLDERILRDFSEEKNKDFINSLYKLLPSKMIPVVARLSGIPFDKKVNQISKAERTKLIGILKGFPLTVKDFRPIDEAIITSGGIKVSEIDPKTMESRLVRNLYFAGEIIDVDAYTGGFNLQIAFSTGAVAGISMREDL